LLRPIQKLPSVVRLNRAKVRNQALYHHARAVRHA
jgi:hypothetical protein